MIDPAPAPAVPPNTEYISVLPSGLAKTLPIVGSAALANTFKDQDRLTQRDIDAARKIVNIFSLARSSADVRASITAISNQLEADIRRQEELYRNAGGLETTINNLRQLADIQTFKKGAVEEALTGDLSLEEIEQGLQEVNL